MHDKENAKNAPKHDSDSETNSYGYKLLNVCIAHSLRILNGRIIGDIPGRFTSYQNNGCSVIDYGICSQNLLNDVQYFMLTILVIIQTSV